MSHTWQVTCKRCRGAFSEDANRGRDDLVAAIRTTPLLVQLAATGVWDHPTLQARDVPGLAGFLVTHAECDAFWVEGEYPGDVAVQVPIPRTTRPGG